MSLADKLPFVGEATRKRNPGLFGRSIEGTGLGLPATPNQERIRQDKKPLLNELEKEWLQCLEAKGVEFIRAQATRFKLANGLWYKVDFTGVISGQRHAWEVKGPKAFRGGFENLKMAANQFPEIHWHLTWKNPAGLWMSQHVLP